MIHLSAPNQPIGHTQYSAAKNKQIWSYFFFLIKEMNSLSPPPSDLETSLINSSHHGTSKTWLIYWRHRTMIHTWSNIVETLSSNHYSMIHPCFTLSSYVSWSISIAWATIVYRHLQWNKAKQVNHNKYLWNQSTLWDVKSIIDYSRRNQYFFAHAHSPFVSFSGYHVVEKNSFPSKTDLFF